MDAETEETTPEHSLPETDVDPAEAEAKWLRVRRSVLIRMDKITQISIQRRDERYFLEIRADRELYLPLPDRTAGLRALDALQSGAADISEWTVARSFMEEQGERS